MIRLPAPAELTPAERYALNLLFDLSRLLPVDDATADVVRLELVDTPEDVPVRDCVAWKWGLAPGDGVVQLPRSSLRRVTDLAGAVVEQRTSARDRYGRVPPSVNALVAAELEREPIVSRAAVTLREMVVTAAGRRIVKCIAPWPEGKRWAAAFTHDLDVVSWWPLFTLLRLSELGRKG